MSLLLVIIPLLLLFVSSPPVHSTTSPTRNAEIVLEHGNLTSYINTLFTISEPFADGTPRYGATARLEGCVRPQQFQAVANSIVFISPNKLGAKNVTECLSYCAALRRLDYWLQTDTNYRNDVSLYELSSGISSDSLSSTTTGTCWCLPQNMTTIEDLILWSNSILPTSNNHNNNSFNDIFLPPACCGPQVNPILNKPGANFVDANVSASSAPSISCPSTVSNQKLLS